MENVIVILILLAITAGILAYLFRSRKCGRKCVGCPYANACAKNQTH